MRARARSLRSSHPLVRTKNLQDASSDGDPISTLSHEAERSGESASIPGISGKHVLRLKTLEKTAGMFWSTRDVETPENVASCVNKVGFALAHEDLHRPTL